MCRFMSVLETIHVVASVVSGVSVAFIKRIRWFMAKRIHWFMNLASTVKLIVDFN
jgi:hypothetical protein